jgi:protein involved in polysaccharide export with SLBB domain
MSRAALQDLVAKFDLTVNSSVYSERLRADARAGAVRIRERLEQGDFRPGDRIVLQIVGEKQTAEMLVVDGDGTISLPGMPPVPLSGVLRSELQEHLEREIGRFIREPTIRTQALIRLSMEGAIGRPGFYVVPAGALLEDVIMQAGGPGPNSDLDKVQIERNGVVLLFGPQVREAFAEGLSVDQLNLRAGDQIVVPMKPPGSGRSMWLTIGRYALMIGGPLFLGVRIF